MLKKKQITSLVFLKYLLYASREVVTRYLLQIITENFVCVNGYFHTAHLTASRGVDHILRKLKIWKHEDYYINIHSIFSSNVFLVISIHIRSCGSDFWNYLLSFWPSNRPKLRGLPIFWQFDHNLRKQSKLSEKKRVKNEVDALFTHKM